MCAARVLLSIENDWALRYEAQAAAVAAETGLLFSRSLSEPD